MEPAVSFIVAEIEVERYAADIDVAAVGALLLGICCRGGRVGEADEAFEGQSYEERDDECRKMSLHIG